MRVSVIFGGGTSSSSLRGNGRIGGLGGICYGSLHATSLRHADKDSVYSCMHAVQHTRCVLDEAVHNRVARNVVPSPLETSPARAGSMKIGETNVR